MTIMGKYGEQLTKEDLDKIVQDQSDLLSSVSSKESNLVNYAAKNCPEFLDFYREYANSWRILQLLAEQNNIGDSRLYFILTQLNPKEKTNDISTKEEKKGHLKRYIQQLNELKNTFNRELQKLNLTYQDIKVIFETIDAQIDNLKKAIEEINKSGQTRRGRLPPKNNPTTRRIETARASRKNPIASPSDQSTQKESQLAQQLREPKDPAPQFSVPTKDEIIALVKNPNPVLRRKAQIFLQQGYYRNPLDFEPKNQESKDLYLKLIAYYNANPEEAEKTYTTLREDVDYSSFIPGDYSLPRPKTGHQPPQ